MLDSVGGCSSSSRGPLLMQLQQRRRGVGATSEADDEVCVMDLEVLELL